MLNTKTKKVTGFYGAGIPLDFGEVVAVYTDKTVDILWNDGNKQNINNTMETRSKRQRKLENVDSEKVTRKT